MKELSDTQRKKLPKRKESRRNIAAALLDHKPTAVAILLSSISRRHVFSSWSNSLLPFLFIYFATSWQVGAVPSWIYIPSHSLALLLCASGLEMRLGVPSWLCRGRKEKTAKKKQQKRIKRGGKWVRKISSSTGIKSSSCFSLYIHSFVHLFVLLSPYICLLFLSQAYDWYHRPLSLVVFRAHWLPFGRAWRIRR